MSIYEGADQRCEHCRESYCAWDLVSFAPTYLDREPVESGRERNEARCQECPNKRLRKEARADYPWA